MLPFYTPCKLHKTCGYRKGTLAWNGLTNNLNWCMHQVILFIYLSYVNYWKTLSSNLSKLLKQVETVLKHQTYPYTF